MNQQRPVKDITYGTKRHGERSYKAALTFLSMMGKLKLNSAEVTTLTGEKLISNVIKKNSGSGVVIFSDRRISVAEIATIKTIKQQNNKTTKQQNNKTTKQQNNKTTKQQNNKTTKQQNNKTTKQQDPVNNSV